MAAGFLRYLSDRHDPAPPVWRTLAMFAGFYGLLLVVITAIDLLVLHVGLIQAETMDLMRSLRMIAVLFVGFGLPLAALLIWRRAGERRAMVSLIRVAGRWRPGLGIAAFAMTMAFVLVSVAAILPGGPEVWLRSDFGGSPDLPSGALILSVLAVGFCIQVGFEELLCRGWLMQRVGWHGHGWLVAGATSAALFTAMHVVTSIEPAELMRLFILGATFAYAVARTGGLEAAFGAHLGNNIAIGIVLSPALIGVEAPSTALQLGVPLLQGLLLVGLVELWLRLFPDAPPEPGRV